MENLKKLEEINEPDDRRKSHVIPDENGFRPLTLNHIYTGVENIELNKNVPTELRNHFEMARNLYLYSWFYHPFEVAAELYAFISVEFALKERFGIYKSPIVIADGIEKIEKQLRNERKKGEFKKMLKRAVSEGHIKDKYFSLVYYDRLLLMASNKTHKPSPLKNPYSNALVEVLPGLRNRAAHGTNMLNKDGSAYLIICAEIINQLFSNK